MRKSRYSDEQIAAALRQAESGVPIAVVTGFKATEVVEVLRHLAAGSDMLQLVTTRDAS